MADAAILNFSTKRNNLDAGWDTVTKFGMMVDMDSPQRALTLFLIYIKIPDGGLPPFWKRKIAITQPPFQISSPDLVCWWPGTASPQSPLMSFLGYSKIQDGGWPPFWKTENGNNSATIWDIVTIFGTVVYMDSPQPAVTSFLTGNEIQDGGRPPFWKMENRHNSAAIWDIFTKFGTQVDMDRPHRAVTSFLT